MLISSNYSNVNAANCTAPGGDGFAKMFRVGKSAAHGDAVKRGRIVGQDGFAFVAPAPKNAFDAAQQSGKTEELHNQILALAKAQNQSTNGGTSIPATFLRVTVCL